MSAKFAYATWLIPFGTDIVTLFGDDHPHISCGVHDDQWECFDVDDDGASLVIESHDAAAIQLTLICPSQGIENEAGYWLSPAVLELLGLNIEASSYGVGTLNEIGAENACL